MFGKTQKLPKNRPVERAEPADKKVIPQPIAELFHSSPDGPVDSVLAAVVIALVGFGVVMVYSASAVEATTRFNDGQYYLKRQAVYAGLATVAMF